MKRGRTEAILEEVRNVVACWPDYADEAGISAIWLYRIAAKLRLERFI